MLRAVAMGKFWQRQHEGQSRATQKQERGAIHLRAGWHAFFSARFWRWESVAESGIGFAQSETAFISRGYPRAFDTDSILDKQGILPPKRRVT